MKNGKAAAEIDHWVYGLYRLTEAEIRAVEMRRT